MPTSRVNSDNKTAGFRETDRLFGPWRVICVLGLMVASAATGALAWTNLTAVQLPGCGGPQGMSLVPSDWGGCAEAGSSSWGRVSIGVASISTAMLGFSVYISALVLVVSAGVRSVAFSWMMRSLSVVSVVFVCVAVTQKVWCPYCMVAHLGIVTAWGSSEIAARFGRVHTRRGVIVSGTVAAALTLVGGIAERTIGEQKVRQSSHAATSNILKQAEVKLVAPSDAQQKFTGRYRLGEENAKVRIVVISDFQCADCQKLDKELIELATRAGVSLSMKHFPFCRDCNSNVPKTLHANACWAARAAEAAGMVGGNARFWEMQKWLFARGGGFAESDLRRQVAAMGMQVDAFMAAFTGRDTLDMVKADVAEAMSLGISRTPMVFVNGVECEGWENAGAVTRIVNALLDANLPHDPLATDQPPRALERYLQMWRAARVETSVNVMVRQRGQGAARIEVVGDYQETGTRELCQLISKVLSEGGSARFAFYQYPADSACNPSIQRSMNDRACEIAKAVLAAGDVGGDIAYWKAHDEAIRIAGMKPLPSDVISPLAIASQIDVEVLRSHLQVHAREIEAALFRSVSINKSGPIMELPTLFVNGKRVIRWKGGVDSEALIRAVIQEASGTATQSDKP